MEELKVEKPGNVTWEYDSEADTLYISFGKPQPALTMDLGSGILMRYVEKTGKIAGFTIVGLSEVLKKKEIA